MYDKFYGLDERPFSLLPDPDFLFLSEKHGAALDLLELAVLNQSGFCVLSGEIGAGKTTLIRELLNRVGDTVQVGLVSNTHPSFGELMQWIMAAYGLECHTADRLTLHKQFIDFVIRSYAANKRTLLIIDEAQNLSTAAMEELRMLSNVNSDKDLVLQVILVGQQQLRDKLRQPKLEQFAQRIAVDFHLRALEEDETLAYIQHRIERAGGSAALFSDATCQMVYHASMGVPRLINRICDLALVHAFSEQSPLVTAAMVHAVVNDQQIGDVLEAARHYVEVVDRDRKQAQERAADVVPEKPESLEPETAVAEAAPKQTVRRVSPAAADLAIPPVAMTGRAARVAAHSDVLRDSVAGSDEDPCETSELHRLVVGAEGKTATKGGRQGFVLPVVLSAALAGVVAAGWFTRDVWSGWRVGDWYRSVQTRLAPGAAVPEATTATVAMPELAGRQGPAVAPLEPRVEIERDDIAGPSVSMVPSAPGQVRTGRTESVAVEPAPHADQTARKTAPIMHDADTLQKQTDVATPEPAHPDEAVKRESKRLARLQEESERLERERRAAERKFAEQLKQRLALEQKMRAERERMLEAKAVAEKIAAERERVERAVIAAPESEVMPAVEPEPHVGNVTSDGAQISEQALVGQRAAQSVAQSEVPLPVQESRLERAETAPAEDRTDGATPTRFVANPCDGPTARFLSTCFQKKP